MNAAAINSLSASGSSNMPIVVIWPLFRARYPSMPSVMDAAINIADARISCSPLKPANRALERTQMSSGMQQIRISVMELGRFTRSVGRGSPRRLNYAPVDSIRQRQAGEQCPTLELPNRREKGRPFQPFQPFHPGVVPVKLQE